jgi:hypothetical protein
MGVFQSPASKDRRFGPGIVALRAACYKCFRSARRRSVSGIRIVVVRHLAKVEARVRFSYPAPFTHRPELHSPPAKGKSSGERTDRLELADELDGRRRGKHAQA